MKSDDEAAPSGLDPFQALARLSNAITVIDHLLAERSQEIGIHPLTRRIIYARNTLAVAHQLWQSDLVERFVQSRNGFYVYCMIDSEKQAFLRRMRPALEFTAEEFRALNLAALGHVIPLVDQAAEDAVRYANENRLCIIMAKDAVPTGSFPQIIDHKAIKLGPPEDMTTKQRQAKTG